MSEPSTPAGRVAGFAAAYHARYAHNPTCVVISRIWPDTPDVRAIGEPAELLVGDLEALTSDARHHDAERTNAATGAPHRVAIGPDGAMEIRHNLGCYRYGGRFGGEPGDLVCELPEYLDQTDSDEQPGPGSYWVTVDVFGRCEDTVDAEWVRDLSDRAQAGIRYIQAQPDAEPAP